MIAVQLASAAIVQPTDHELSAAIVQPTDKCILQLQLSDYRISIEFEMHM